MMALTEAMLIQGLRGFSGLMSDAREDTALFSSGLLDSVEMVNLLSMVEELTGLYIEADEVTLENFDTPSRIVRFAQARGR